LSPCHLVTFRLDGRLFGTDVLHVKEVSTPPPITPVPLAPAAVRGYVNLRGQIHLVLDLKRMLGTGTAAPGPDARLVLFKPVLGDPFGVLVDRIGDIVALHPEQIEESEGDVGSAGEGGLLSGIAKLEGELLVLVDARKLLPHVERSLLPFSPSPLAGQGRGRGERPTEGAP
jgi:purine-binding chemotaxis protein CheW